MTEMHTMEAKIQEMEELKCQLMSCLKVEMAKGIQSMDTNEASEAVDMVKDLAEAIKCCREACYFETVTQAMKGESESYGYNPNRSSTTGRYTSGYRPINPSPSMGFRPMPAPMGDMPWEDDVNPKWYSPNESQMMGYQPMTPSRYGQAYNDYRNSRRHYTETKSEADKKEMKEHMMEHVRDTVTAMKEMWQDADPETRKKLKTELQQMINDLPA